MEETYAPVDINFLNTINSDLSKTINNYFEGNKLQSWVGNYKKQVEIDSINNEIMRAERKYAANLDKINELDSVSQQNRNIVKAVKNQNNSEILNVHRLMTGDTPDSTFYLVFGNGGCISYENDKPINIKRCNAADEAQLFKVSHQTNQDVDFNYWYVSPKNDGTKRITFSDSGLSITPYNVNNIGQRFSPLYHHPNC